MCTPAPPLASVRLLGCEVQFEVCDALAEAGQLWPVTVQLAEFLAAEFAPPHGLRGKTVVELGAGTGALSCAVANAYEGVDVVATDLPSVLPLLQRNVARCCARGDVRGATAGRVRVAPLPWGGLLDGFESVDVVLCCDCLYWGGWDVLQTDTLLPLRRTLCALAGPGRAAVYIAFTARDGERELGFVRTLLREDGFDCRCAPSSATLDGAQEGDNVVLVLTRGQQT